MRQILDRLLLGDLAEAGDPEFIDGLDVHAILYFGSGGGFPEGVRLYHRAARKDGRLTHEMLCDGIEFLRESLAAGRRVLAVGPTGATIAAAYLAEMGFSPAQAIQMLAETPEQPVPRPDVLCLSEHATELERRSQITLGHR